jgi:hypothetical protein
MGAGSECGDGDAEDSNPIEVLPSYKLDLQRPVVLGGAAGARAGPPPPSHMLASPSKAARASSTGRAELSRTVHFAEIQMVFSAREDGTVAFWDVHSERARAEVHHLRAHKVRCRPARALRQHRMSPFGRGLTSTCWTARARRLTPAAMGSRDD